MARTPKARALGVALRQAREKRGLVLRALAAEINRDPGALSRWETGDRTPKPEQVAQILTHLTVHGERYDEIMTLAYRTDESMWMATTLPEQRQQMTAYVDWEQNACRIVEVAPLLVPGLLQTDDYIRAIMTADAPPDEITSRLEQRIGRRNVITKAKPANLLVLLGQNVLSQDIGGKQVTAGQIEHLLKMAAQPNIELRIMPNHIGWHPGLEAAFTMIEADRGGLKPASIVFVGNRRSVLMLHQEADVGAYKRAIDQIMRVTLSPDTSMRFIADLNKRLERAQ
jgi:Domain of unknown function (DUF5753)/Helix-turn-helix domain